MMDEQSRELLERVRAVVEERNALRADAEQLTTERDEAHLAIDQARGGGMEDLERQLAEMTRKRDALRADRDEAHAYAGRIAAAADAWDRAASAYYASEGAPSEWDAMQAAKRAFHAALRGAR